MHSSTPSAEIFAKSTRQIVMDCACCEAFALHTENFHGNPTITIAGILVVHRGPLATIIFRP